MSPEIEIRLTTLDEHEICPWNDERYRLVGGFDFAQVEITDDNPDLILAATDLASVYLGAASLGTMLRAGRVDEHSSGSQILADAMFVLPGEKWTLS